MGLLVRRAPSGFVLSLLALAACARVEPPRHLLLVTVDTLRATRLDAWGAARGTSDRAHAERRGSTAGFTLDEVAASGVRFSRAYAPRGETFPSLCTLLTGRPPLETGVVQNKSVLAPDSSALAERLHAAGYRSAAFTTNRLLVRGSGIEQGFDEFWSDASDERDAKALAEASAWIARQDLERGPPLFVWVHLMGPHLPYDPAPLAGVEFAALFADAGYAGAADGSRAFVDGAYTSGRGLASDDVARIVALYDGEVARVDALLSAFFAQHARPGGLLESALLVFTADHGEELHDRNRYIGHSKSVYADVLHVPLVLRLPDGSGAGSVIEAVVELEDVLPTALELLGQAAPDVHGRSLRALLQGEPLAEEPAFGQWRERIFAVHERDLALVWNPERIEPLEEPPGPYPVPELALYDLARDPLELVDVSRARPADVQRLLDEIVRWRSGLAVRAALDVELSAERLQALRELGYAGGDGR
jgi:arylsulfatase A-like enzyme